MRCAAVLPYRRRSIVLSPKGPAAPGASKIPAENLAFRFPAIWVEVPFSSALEAEQLLSIASDQRRDGRSVETLNGRNVAKRVILRQVIGIVRAEQDIIPAEHSHQRGELVRCEHHRIDIDSSEVIRGRLRQSTVTIGTRAPSMVDAPGISAKISAAMHRQDLEPGMTLEHAIEYQIMQRDRRLQRIADNIVEVKACQPGRAVKPLGWIITKAPSSSAFCQNGANARSDSSLPATFVRISTPVKPSLRMQRSSSLAASAPSTIGTAPKPFRRSDFIAQNSAMPSLTICVAFTAISSGTV